MNVVSNNTTVKAFALPFRVRRYKLDDRLSLDYAKRQGYRVSIFGDGFGTVEKPDGNTYHISDFRCDCPDAIQRDGGTYQTPDGNFCKHAFWLHQLSICKCGQAAELVEFESAKHTYHQFTYVCECGCERTVEQVKRERQMWKEDVQREAAAKQLAISA